jgi:hypothetical protein
MESKEKKSINYYMRFLHRNLGFFMLGFVLIYSLSGIALIYRDTDFLKHEKKISINLSPGLNPSEIGNTLRIRDFKLEKTEGDICYFRGGSYNKTTGITEQTTKELIFPLNKFSVLHKTASNNFLHWFTATFGILLFFMAISSLWMFKSDSKIFRRGILTVAAGIIIAIIVLILVK